MKNGKVWGVSEAIFAMNNVEFHRIEIVAGGYCSKHYHANKWNMFFVEKGDLEISSWPNANANADVTILSDGETIAIRPGEPHRFRAITATVAYEIYWSSLDAADIVREDVGGVHKCEAVEWAKP